jgi:uncharacterized protein YciI
MLNLKNLLQPRRHMLNAMALVFASFMLCGGYAASQPQDKTGDSTNRSTSTEAKQEGSQSEKAGVQDKFNAELAKELGADEYGMKRYVFVLLKTGKVKIEDKAESGKVFAGHFANMSRLAKEGKLVMAGPFIEGETKRGLFVLNVTTIEDAEKLVKTDPAVAAGVLDYELTKLYCSAALMKVTEIHETIQKSKIE